MTKKIRANDVVPQVKEYLLEIQNHITNSLEAEETEDHKFKEDAWHYKHGKGGGKTRVLANGNIFEKAGVNFSHVVGDKLPAAATQARPDLAGHHFQALGVSLVIHPRNPFIPTSHANIRFFIAEKAGSPARWWFGGGFDLTPYYGFKEDCIHWHEVAKKACDPFGADIYLKHKQWCDNYFFLPHRNEARGVGGLFYDDLNEWRFDKCFSHMQSIGNHFTQAYIPIVHKRKEHDYTDKQKKFQLYRRGRYVEFNLVYDRGTIFGLQSKGRTESILMSLPPQVEWHYNWQPTPGSLEEKLYTEFLPARDWLSN